MIGGEQPALDLREQADGADRVFIDGVVMIHVELHLRVDPAKVRHEATKHARFVHPAQRGFRILATAEQFEEQPVCALVAAHLAIDQPGIAIGQAHGFRVDFQPSASASWNTSIRRTGSARNQSSPGARNRPPSTI